MISVMHRKRVPLYVGFLSVVVLIVGGFVLVAPKAHAAGAWGDSGGTTGGSGSGYYTTNGFGWKLFDVTSGGPSGGFKSGNWGSISSQCAGLGDNRVWVHVVRNPGGQEKSFTYQGASYNRNRPAAGSDPYDYNAAGAYIGRGPAAYNQSVINIVTTVDGYYQEANPSNSGWGVNVGWFCWSDNPPWAINAISSVNMTTAKPNDNIIWSHQVNDTGAAVPANKSIHSNIAISGFTNGWASTVADGDSTGGPGVIRTLSDYTQYKVQQSDVGNTLCEKLQYSPTDSNGGTNGRGTNLCVNVPYNYTITPTVKVTSIQGESGSNLTTAKPGDVINWGHTASNTGYTKTKEAVSVYYIQNSPSNTTGPSNTINAGSNPGTSTSFSSSYTVSQSDVGKQVCRATQANPGSSAGGLVTSAYVCVNVPYNYTLTPTMNLDQSSVEAGMTVTGSPTVGNSGPTISQSTQWQVSEVVVAPGSAVPGVGGSTSSQSNPCGFFSPAQSCAALANGTGNSVFNTNGAVLSGSALNNYPVVMPDLTVGTKICLAFSIQPPSSSASASTWAHSALKCATIGKKPKVQIHGGDLMVGRPFNGLSAPSPASVVNTSTSLRTINGTTYTFGSWIEYGIFAVGTVTGAGSGSAFAGSGLSNSTSVCDYSALTFVNATTSSPATSCSGSAKVGGYSTGRTIPNIASDFPIVTTGTSTTPVYDDTAATPQGLYTSDANGDAITVAASGTKYIAKGEWVVINAPNADVTIANDIIYANPTTHAPEALGSIYDIPQLVIIAKDIYINPNVKEVDAWLIAQGSSASGTGILDTCHTANDSYNTPETTNANQTDVCDTALQVNGPVMAQKLWLRRTGGATSADPAEIFNLRPDAYLWAYARASTAGRIQTVYSQELPPRF